MPSNEAKSPAVWGTIDHTYQMNTPIVATIVRAGEMSALLTDFRNSSFRSRNRAVDS